MKVPAQQSSCVVLSAIFFSTTVSSQDSIKYLEDLNAEILYLHHTQWPSRSMCWSSQRINFGHTYGYTAPDAHWLRAFKILSRIPTEWNNRVPSLRARKARLYPLPIPTIQRCVPFPCQRFTTGQHIFGLIIGSQSTIGSTTVPFDRAANYKNKWQRSFN